MSDLQKLRKRVEIDTIHELLDRLSYYQLLEVDKTAHQSEIEPAFRAASRKMHPDRLARLGDKDAIRKATTIYRLIGEAHKCLRDPDTRAAYDGELANGSLRLSEEGGAEGGSNDPALAAKTEKGQKYWAMALQQWRDEDYSGCVMNVQFALSFEKDNETFKEYLDKAKKAAKEANSKKEKNPYKLRIV